MDITKKQLESVLALLPDACLLLDTAGRVVFANDYAYQLLGYPPGALVGLPVEELLPDRLRKSDSYYRSRFKGKPERKPTFEGSRVYCLRKDGREVPIEVGTSTVGSGAESLVIVNVRNITARVELEHRLREAAASLEQRAKLSEVETRRANEQFMLFLKHAPAAIAMLDRNMRYLIVSNRWLDDFGLSGHDIHGLYHYDLFPDTSEKWKEVHKRVLTGEVMQSDEDSVIGVDGRRQWLFWECHPWRWADGRIGGVLWFSEVITRRKLAEAELIKSHQELEQRVADRTAELQATKDAADRANAQKSWFVAAASHDLRQPLQAATSYLSVLALRADAELGELCEKTRQPLRAMGDILDVLLDISDLESGRVKPRLQDFAIDPLLGRVVGNTQQQASDKGLRLSCLSTGVWVRSDPKLLERVLSNFVANAIRYTDKGLIGIYCECTGDTVQVSVTDTGIGIPADALDAIFEDHVQLANPARDRRKGLGLGLSIAKRIADALGHHISVQSEIGSGSSFAIELPAAAGATAAATPSPPDKQGKAQTSGESRPLVLLIDDDPDVAEAMQMLLGSYGFESYVAAGRDSALAMVESGLTPGLVLCDYRLPGVSGVDVIRQVRQALNTTVPAILVTGDLGLQRCPEDLERCGLLHKPVEMDKVLATFAQLAAAS